MPSQHCAVHAQLMEPGGTNYNLFICGMWLLPQHPEFRECWVQFLVSLVSSWSCSSATIMYMLLARQHIIRFTPGSHIMHVGPARQRELSELHREHTQPLLPFQNYRYMLSSTPLLPGRVDGYSLFCARVVCPAVAYSSHMWSHIHTNLK